MPDACDDRFAAAMRRLTDLHAEASLYRGAREAAERVFADGLRVGDGVRRAMRQRRPGRPDESDCVALEAAAARIAATLQGIARGDALARLDDAVSRRDSLAVAAHACSLFAGLTPHIGPAGHGYRAVAVRERRRSGEALPAAEDLARRVADRATAGLGPEARSDRAPAGMGDAADAIVIVPAPRPLVLSPSLDACGSEVALRVALAEVEAPVLAHEDTGDLWIFSAAPVGPVAVALRAQPDDEWWTASPVPYADYVGRLRSVLTARGVCVEIEDPAGD